MTGLAAQKGHVSKASQAQHPATGLSLVGDQVPPRLSPARPPPLSRLPARPQDETYTVRGRLEAAGVPPELAYAALTDYDSLARVFHNVLQSTTMDVGGQKHLVQARAALGALCTLCMLRTPPPCAARPARLHTCRWRSAHYCARTQPCPRPIPPALNSRLPVRRPASGRSSSSAAPSAPRWRSRRTQPPCGWPSTWSRWVRPGWAVVVCCRAAAAAAAAAVLPLLLLAVFAAAPELAGSQGSSGWRASPGLS